MSYDHRTSVLVMAWLNIALGALILLTPLLSGDVRGAALANGIVIGAAVITLSGANAYSASRGETRRAYGPAVVNVLLGLWAVTSGFVLAVTAGYTMLMAVFGTVLALGAGYNVWASNDAPAPAGGAGP